MYKSVIVFGDVTGWGRRFTLSKTSTESLVEANDMRTFANVDVGPISLSGPIVQETHDGENNLTVIYVSREVPAWVDTNVVQDFGWQNEEFPRGLTNKPLQVETLVLNLDGTNVEGWSKTVWLNEVPRPMERFQLPIDENVGLFVEVRALEGGIDASTAAFERPWIVVAPSNTELLSIHNITEFGWIKQDWVESRQETWNTLLKLSYAIETHSVPLMNTSIVQDVEIHDLLAIDERSIPLIPRDVRDGLERALLALPDATEETHF